MNVANNRNKGHSIHIIICIMLFYYLNNRSLSLRRGLCHHVMWVTAQSKFSSRFPLDLGRRWSEFVFYGWTVRGNRDGMRVDQNKTGETVKIMLQLH